MRTGRHAAALLLILGIGRSGALRGQPTVAPSPETVGRVRGENAGNYNVVHSFETGYRFHTVDGNRDRYRSDVNFGNGLRLLGSNLTVNSKEGHGRWFDELVLQTQGIGNDPYQFASARLQHNKLYRYDFTFRINDYVNPGLTTGTLGGHFLNTRRQMQDHDVTLLPSAPFRLLAGYSRNSQAGPGLTSIQLFDSRGDEYPLFTEVDRRQSELRLGAEARVSGYRFVVLRGWQRYREQMPRRIDAPQTGAISDDLNTLASFRSPESYNGDTPYWRMHLLGDKKAWYSVSGRFSYAGGRRHFLLEELSAGAERRGLARDRQILVNGSGRRPVSSGSLTVSLFSPRRVTFANHTAFHQIAMDGDSSYREFNNATLGVELLRFQYLGIRTIVNSSDLTFRANRWLAVYGGHQYSNRRIRSREGETIDTFTGVTEATQTNHLHAGLVGLRIQPVRPLSISVDSEAGRSDKPFTPIADRKYHVLGGRVQYRKGPATVTAYSKAAYNTNSSSLFVHSGRSRVQAVDASWAARSSLSFDAGYTKQHWDTLTGLAYFAGGEVTGDQSVYTSNIHTAYLSVRASIRKTADLTFGFHRVQDTGDGRGSPAAVPSGARPGSMAAAFRAAQTFPLRYQSPLARLSVKVHDKVRWNLGYQFYHYKEEFFTSRNYRANTGFTSVVWSF